MTIASGKPSETWGPVLAGLLLLCLVAGVLACRLSCEVPANHFYVEGRCALFDKRVAEDQDNSVAGSKHYRGATNRVYRPEFLIRYTVAGREHQVWAYNSSATTRLGVGPRSLSWRASPSAKSTRAGTTQQTRPAWCWSGATAG